MAIFAIYSKVRELFLIKLGIGKKEAIENIAKKVLLLLLIKSLLLLIRNTGNSELHVAYYYVLLFIDIICQRSAK